jgi:hypothetical protein
MSIIDPADTMRMAMRRMQNISEFRAAAPDRRRIELKFNIFRSAAVSC